MELYNRIAKDVAFLKEYKKAIEKNLTINQLIAHLENELEDLSKTCSE